MRNRLFYTLYLLTLMVATYSCTRGKADDAARDTSSTEAAPTPVMVTTAQAVNKTFNSELLCNGTLEAANNARVGFEAAGTIENVQIKSGDYNMLIPLSKAYRDIKDKE